MIDALIQAAEARGIAVWWHRGGPKGAWLPEANAVTIRHGMDDAETISTIAHELGHAHHGDPAGHLPAFERRADEFAARLIISPVEYAAAEIQYGPHPAGIARELGVTKHLVEIFQTLNLEGITS